MSYPLIDILRLVIKKEVNDDFKSNVAKSLVGLHKSILYLN